TVKLGGHVHGEVAVSKGLCSSNGIGCGREKVPTQSEEDARTPLEHRVNRLDGVVAHLARNLDSKLSIDSSKECLRHPFEDAHRSVALNIAVSSNRTDACAGTPDASAHQKDVDDFANVRDGISMLREPHGPARNRSLGLDEYASDGRHLLSRDAATAC